MTLAGKIAALFPALHLLLILNAIYTLITEPSPYHLTCVPFWIYIFPIIVYRVHNAFFPVVEGVTDLGSKSYSPWWTSHQIQMMFMAVPWLEGVLHLVPGLFSLWLRLWGSKIGKKVYWTPRVEVVDRGLIEVGDRTVIGHLTAMCSHAVTPIDGKASLIIRKIKIGERALIGAQVGLGPGATVADGELVKFGAKLFWKGTWS